MQINHITPGNPCLSTSTVSWQSCSLVLHALCVYTTLGPRLEAISINHLISHMKKKAKRKQNVISISSFI